MAPEKPPFFPPLVAAIRRLSEWNEGGEANQMPVGYGPDTLTFQIDVRLILAEYRKIAAENARIQRNYEILNSIVVKLRASDAALTNGA